MALSDKAANDFSSGFIGQNPDMPKAAGFDHRCQRAKLFRYDIRLVRQHEGIKLVMDDQSGHARNEAKGSYIPMLDRHAMGTIQFPSDFVADTPGKPPGPHVMEKRVVQTAGRGDEDELGGKSGGATQRGDHRQATKRMADDGANFPLGFEVIDHTGDARDEVAHRGLVARIGAMGWRIERDHPKALGFQGLDQAAHASTIAAPTMDKKCQGPLVAPHECFCDRRIAGNGDDGCPQGSAFRSQLPVSPGVHELGRRHPSTEPGMDSFQHNHSCSPDPGYDTRHCESTNP